MALLPGLLLHKDSGGEPISIDRLSTEVLHCPAFHERPQFNLRSVYFNLDAETIAHSRSLVEVKHGLTQAIELATLFSYGQIILCAQTSSEV